MLKNKRNIIILIVIAFIVLISCTLYFIMKNKYSRDNITNLVKNASIPNNIYIENTMYENDTYLGVAKFYIKDNNEYIYQENKNQEKVEIYIDNENNTSITILHTEKTITQNNITENIDFEAHLKNNLLEVLNNKEEYSYTFKGKEKIDEINYKNLIIKLEKNLNLFYRIDIFFDQNGEIENYKLSNFLKEIKNNFEYIILDLTSNIKYKFIKTILISSNKIIFLLEPNLIEIKKTNNILEIFLKDFNIEIDKIKIVFNKTNKYQLAESILEELFSNFEIIGNIKYSEQYNNLINTNNFKNIDKSEYEKIYKKI